LLSKQQQIEDELRENRVKDIQVCECCGILARNEELPDFIKLEELSLGVGIHLFFKNYFFHAVVFLLLFLVYSVFALVTNVLNYYAQLNQLLCIDTLLPCGLAIIGGGSKRLAFNPPDNKFQENMTQIQSWLAVGFVILWGLLYIVKNIIEDRFVMIMHDKRVSASDFTLMLTHVPYSYFN
jgi:hypothetical protein